MNGTVNSIIIIIDTREIYIRIHPSHSLQLLTVYCSAEISPEPSNLALTIDPNNDRTVTLTWNAPTETSELIVFNSAEFYVIEQSINNEEYTQVIIDSLQ